MHIYIVNRSTSHQAAPPTPLSPGRGLVGVNLSLQTPHLIPLTCLRVVVSWGSAPHFNPLTVPVKYRCGPLTDCTISARPPAPSSPSMRTPVLSSTGAGL